MKKILIVEDNALNMELTTQLLEDHYQIVQATDGLAGLDATKEHEPDLILLDLSLPKIDGWEVVRRLRADWSTCKIPIVALSAHAAQADISRAIAAGCDAYLTKPVDEDLLLAEIARQLGPPQGGS